MSKQMRAEIQSVRERLALHPVHNAAIAAALETYEPADVTAEIVEAYAELV